MSENQEDPTCTDCGGTGWTLQTERRCACQEPAPKPFVRGEKLKLTDAPSSMEEAAKRRHDAYWAAGGPYSNGRGR